MNPMKTTILPPPTLPPRRDSQLPKPVTPHRAVQNSLATAWENAVNARAGIRDWIKRSKVETGLEELEMNLSVAIGILDSALLDLEPPSGKR